MKGLKEKWNLILDYLSKKFSSDEKLDLESVIFLIGLQELGKTDIKFTKKQKKFEKKRIQSFCGDITNEKFVKTVCQKIIKKTFEAV